jgi:hypothetical protein
MASYTSKQAVLPTFRSYLISPSSRRSEYPVAPVDTYSTGSTGQWELFHFVRSAIASGNEKEERPLRRADPLWGGGRAE